MVTIVRTSWDVHREGKRNGSEILDAHAQYLSPGSQSCPVSVTPPLGCAAPLGAQSVVPRPPISSLKTGCTGVCGIPLMHFYLLGRHACDVSCTYCLEHFYLLNWDPWWNIQMSLLWCVCVYNYVYIQGGTEWVTWLWFYENIHTIVC